MRYQEVIPAVFLERPNRFIALVLVNGQTERRGREPEGRGALLPVSRADDD